MTEFMRRWNELITLPIAIMLWYASPYFFRWIDPTAGAYDIGVLQALLIATVALFFGKPVVLLIMRISAPDVYKVLDDFLSRNKDNISRWERGKFALWYYSIHLLAWVLLVMAFLGFGFIRQ